MVADLNGAAGARRRAAAARAAAEAARLAALRQATRATAVRLYVTWREGLARAAAEEAGVAALAGSLRLASRRRGAGLVSGLEPAAAEASRAAAAARIPAARQGAETARLALEALLGISAGHAPVGGGTRYPQRRSARHPAGAGRSAGAATRFAGGGVGTRRHRRGGRSGAA
jgi:outer membrane protein TolC